MPRGNPWMNSEIFSKKLRSCTKSEIGQRTGIEFLSSKSTWLEVRRRKVGEGIRDRGGEREEGIGNV